MFTRVRIATLFFTLAPLSAAAPAQNPPLFHFTEPPGPNQVGLKVVEQYDYSRTYRPLEVYTLVALIYFMLLAPLTALVGRLEGKTASS